MLNRKSGQYKSSKQNLTFFEIIGFLSLCLAPFDAVLLLPYKILGIHLSIPRILIIITGTISLLSLSKIKLFLTRVKKDNHIFFFCFILWNIISGLWAYNLESYMRYIGLLFMFGILYYFVILTSLSAPKYLLIIKLTVLVVLISIIFGYIELATGYRISASRQWAFKNEITSLFLNPSHFGAMLSLFAPFAFTYLLWRKNNLSKAFVGVILLFFSSIYLSFRTGSRGAFVGLFMGCLCSLLFSLLKKVDLRFFIRFSFLLLILIFILMLNPVKKVPSAVKDKIYMAKNPIKLIAENERVEIWKSGIQIWKESFLIGWGAGSSEYLISDKVSWLGVYSMHSWFYEVLINTGIIGACLWSLIMAGLIWSTINILRHSNKSKLSIIAVGFLSSLVPCIIISLTLGSLITFQFFWVYLALWAGVGAFAEKIKEESIIISNKKK